jgi:hypothetical protein
LGAACRQRVREAADIEPAGGRPAPTSTAQQPHFTSAAAATRQRDLGPVAVVATRVMLDASDRRPWLKSGMRRYPLGPDGRIKD